MKTEERSAFKTDTKTKTQTKTETADRFSPSQTERKPAYLSHHTQNSDPVQEGSAKFCKFLQKKSFIPAGFLTEKQNKRIKFQNKKEVRSFFHAANGPKGHLAGMGGMKCILLAVSG